MVVYYLALSIKSFLKQKCQYMQFQCFLFNSFPVIILTNLKQYINHHLLLVFFFTILLNLSVIIQFFMAKKLFKKEERD